MTQPSHAPNQPGQQVPAEVAMHPALAAVAEAEPVQVAAPADSRLAQLQSQYAEAKSAADAAAEHLKGITDAIKHELTRAAPEHTKIDLPAGHGPALRLTYSERWSLDTRRMKAEDPLTYVRYAKKGGAWTLRAMGAR